MSGLAGILKLISVERLLHLFNFLDSIRNLCLSQAEKEKKEKRHSILVSYFFI